MKKLFIALIVLLCFSSPAYCANVYWVGGGSSANWNATGNTNWGTSSGTRDNAGVPGAADDVIFDSHANGNTPCTLTASTTIKSLVMTGWANTLTHNASVTLTINGQDGGGNSLILVSGMTYTLGNAKTSKITFSGVGTNKITTGGKTVGELTFNNSGDTFQLQDTLNTTGDMTAFGTSIFDANGQTVNFLGTATYLFHQSGSYTFSTLNITGTAIKTESFRMNCNVTVTNTLNIDGNSGVNRLLFYSDTLGTARTLTITGATISGCTNVDFRDITFANGGSNVDFSAITGGSGNCGGNTISGGGVLSFTTADDWYWNGSGTRNFSDYTYWYTATNGGGSQMASTTCPLPQDTCYFDASSIDGATTVDQDLPRIPGINFTGVAAMAFHINNISQITYGSLTLVNNVTVTYSTSYTFTFQGRSGAYTFTHNNGTFATALYIQTIGGSVTLGANFLGSNLLQAQYGTLDADTYNITTSTFNSDNTNIRTLLMGSGTWTVNSTTAGNTWDIGVTTNMTSTNVGETSTINWGGATNNALVFEGGGCTYNNITVVATGTNHKFTGSNTFATFTITAPKTVYFTAGTTTTVTSFVATGTAVNPITITSPTAAVHYLKDTTGTNTVSYCTISYSYVYGTGGGGGALWDASDGTNTDGGNNQAYDSATNEGWKFSAGAVAQPFLISNIF